MYNYVELMNALIMFSTPILGITLAFVTGILISTLIYTKNYITLRSFMSDRFEALEHVPANLTSIISKHDHLHDHIHNKFQKEDSGDENATNVEQAGNKEIAEPDDGRKILEKRLDVLDASNAASDTRLEDLVQKLERMATRYEKDSDLVREELRSSSGALVALHSLMMTFDGNSEDTGKSEGATIEIGLQTECVDTEHVFEHETVQSTGVETPIEISERTELSDLSEQNYAEVPDTWPQKCNKTAALCKQQGSEKGDFGTQTDNRGSTPFAGKKSVSGTDATIQTTNVAPLKFSGIQVSTTSPKEPIRGVSAATRTANTRPLELSTIHTSQTFPVEAPTAISAAAQTMTSTLLELSEIQTTQTPPMESSKISTAMATDAIAKISRTTSLELSTIQASQTLPIEGPKISSTFPQTEEAALQPLDFSKIETVQTSPKEGPKPTPTATETEQPNAPTLSQVQMYQLDLYPTLYTQIYGDGTAENPGLTNRLYLAEQLIENQGEELDELRANEMFLEQQIEEQGPDLAKLARMEAELDALRAEEAAMRTAKSQVVKMRKELEEKTEEMEGLKLENKGLKFEVQGLQGMAKGWGAMGGEEERPRKEEKPKGNFTFGMDKNGGEMWSGGSFVFGQGGKKDGDGNVFGGRESRDENGRPKIGVKTEGKGSGIKFESGGDGEQGKKKMKEKNEEENMFSFKPNVGGLKGSKWAK